MSRALGYVGLGNMGGALAQRLVCQHPLQVYDRNEESVSKLVASGAIACTGLAQMADQCDLILLCLPSSREVREVIFGEGGLAAHLRPGTLIVDQTTGDPQATRAMAAQLAQQDVELIDAPVSGGPRGASAGTIAIMVGANPEQYARIEPLLQTISPNLFHAGDVGAGQVIKLANNMLHHSQRLLTLEAMSLAVKNGVAPAKAVEILLASSGRNYYTEHNLESRILAGKLASGFTLELLLKDVRLATQLGADSGVPLFFANLVREFYQMCASELGSDAQVNSVALLVDRIAGTQLVPKDHSLS